MWKSFIIAAAGALMAAIVVIVIMIALIGGGGDVSDFHKQCSQLNGVVAESTDGIVCRYNKDEVINYE